MVVVQPRIILFFAAAGAAAALLAFRFDPLKPHARLLKRCAAGLFLLLAWNAFLPRLGVNPLSALLAGTLGVPGLGLLAVLARLP